MSFGSKAASFARRGTALVPWALVGFVIVESVAPIVFRRHAPEYTGGAAIASPEAVEHARREHTEPLPYRDHPVAPMTRGTAEPGSASFGGTQSV